MSPQAPVRSIEQCRAALEKANRVRTRRAQMKADVLADESVLVGLIEHPPWWLATMKVDALLLALRQVGVVKANRIRLDCRISASKTVGGMSDRQRDALLARLGVVRQTPDLLTDLAVGRSEAVGVATRPLSVSEQAREA